MSQKLVKMESGTVVLWEGAAQVASFKSTSKVTRRDNTSVFITSEDNTRHVVLCAGLQTQIAPAAALDFSGLSSDLIALLAADFFTNRIESTSGIAVELPSTPTASAFTSSEVTTSGSIAAGALAVMLTFSSDFVGAVNSVNRAAGSMWGIEAAGYRLPTIPYTIAAGKIILDVIR